MEGGGSCSVVENWRDCVQKFAGVAYANDVVRTCAATINVRTIPAWHPSPDNPQKRQVADELRREIEAQWPGAEKIVIRDFNLEDPQITFDVRMPDGEYYQGCSFHAMRKPACESWHLFGGAPPSAIREWIFERPYRLK